MTRHTKLTMMLGATALSFAALDASAQGRNCGPHEAVVAHLAERFSETRQAIALAANNQVMELYAAESGSWTLLVTRPGGPACIVAAGQNFELTTDPLPNTDPEA